MELTEQHVHVLRHALGLKNRGDRPWRNRFVAGEGHADMPVLNDLLVNGYLTVQDNPGGSGYLFQVTEKGREAAGSEVTSP